MRGAAGVAAGLAVAACAIAVAAGSRDAVPDATAHLNARPLAMPVAGIAASALQPAFDDDRGGRAHRALDIAAPRGTPVRAVDDGRIVKLFHSVPGGLTVYQLDPQGRLAYYYAHLDRYAAGLKEGQAVRRCDVLGHVGTTGNAAPDAPHLHFAVFALGPERRWWEGEAIDPYPALRASAVVCPAPSR